MADIGSEKKGAPGETVTFGHSRGSPREARRFVRRVAAHRADLDDLELLVSELVTNAVVYATGDVEVTICLGADRVRVAVGDGNGTPPNLRSPDAAGGRGLHLVEAVASRWGVEGRAGGKSVWFEMDGPAPRPSRGHGYSG